MTKRKSNVGCLGCFWFIGLVFFTLLEAGILYWLNPLWLDERAFWRGEIYGPESFFVAATDDELEAMAPPLLTPEERVGLWHEMAVRADYDPDSGISMETVEGAKFEFMPGSIEGAPEIEIVPVHTVPPEMTEQRGVVPVGPLHDLRIGGAEHYDFGIGVPASFRYDPEAVGNGRIAVGTWVDDRWVELPSRVDSRTGTVTATLEHASLIGGIVIVGTAVIGTWGTQTASGRSLAKALGTNLDETYDTKNFAIHYSTRIGIAVPTDAVYPSTRGRTTTDVPLFVQDVGAYLEEAFAGLGELGISPAAAEYLRHDAFLRPSPDFGASPLGGPLLLDNDFRDPDSGAFPGDMAYRMRATCTHELVHVGQDPYFNTFTSTAARWWIEATAEYLANRFVASRGQALTGVDYYVDGTPKLLATPWDKSEGLASYAWARFLDWLATAKGVDTVALVKAVNGRGASLQNIDSALRSAGHEGLSPYFEDFAKAFHHENLWTGAFCDPSIVQANVRQFERFGHLAARPRNASAVRLIVYREHTFAQRHLSATHVLFQGGPFPADARAKLVIHLPGVERDGGRHFAFAAGLGEFNLPLTGSPTPLAPVELAGGTGGVCWVSEQLGELTDAPGGVRQVSFLLGNHSVKQDAPGVTVRRWLLMPPRNVVYRRDPATEDYEVTWQESVLAEQDKHDEFAGYNVYRRMPGDSDFPEEPLNPALLTTTNFTDTPPDGQDCVYTVTVVDSLGNESLPAEAQDRDPFQGTWAGKLLLVEGELVTPIQRWLDETGAELEETRAAELAAAQDAEERERIRTSHESARESDRKFEAAVIPAVEKIAAVVRLGVPIELEIALRDGKYFAKVTKVMLARADPDEDENPEIELVLRGERTIAPKDLPTELDMVMLPLHREDEINHVWRFELDTEQGTLAYGIRVDLKREPF